MLLRITLLAMFLFGAVSAAPDRSGTYVGTYSSTDGDSAGKLRLVIEKNADATWLCKVFFTPESDEIATKPGACSIDGDKIATEFDVDMEGSAFHAALKGSAVDDKSFQGTYTTTGSGNTDHGTWKVSLRP
jgi:hypothetical protein